MQSIKTPNLLDSLSCLYRPWGLGKNDTCFLHGDIYGILRGQLIKPVAQIVAVEKKIHTFMTSHTLSMEANCFLVTLLAFWNLNWLLHGYHRLVIVKVYPFINLRILGVQNNGSNYIKTHTITYRCISSTCALQGHINNMLHICTKLYNHNIYVYHSMYFQVACFVVLFWYARIFVPVN